MSRDASLPGGGLRELGNAAAARGDFARALGLYAAAHAAHAEHLSASNAALMALHLNRPLLALRWADAALEACPLHAKSQLRRGKALALLGRFDDARAALQAPPLTDPQWEPCARATLDAVERGEAEARGAYAWPALLEAAHERPRAPLQLLADHAHAALRVVPVPGRGLGVISTAALAPGSLLVVARPVAGIIVWPTVTRLLDAAGSLTDRRTAVLACRLAERMMSDDPDAAVVDAAVRALSRGVAEGAPLCSAAAVAAAVVKANAFLARSFTDAIVSDAADTGGGASGDGDEASATSGAGLWVLPARFNHSCAPNCAYLHVGDAMVVKLLDAVVPGDELTVSYVGVADGNGLRAGHDERRRRLRAAWGFDCDCRLCTEESAALAALDGAAVDAATAFNAVRDAWLADAVPAPLRAVARPPVSPAAERAADALVAAVRASLQAVPAAAPGGLLVRVHGARSLVAAACCAHTAGAFAVAARRYEGAHALFATPGVRGAAGARTAVEVALHAAVCCAEAAAAAGLPPAAAGPAARRWLRAARSAHDVHHVPAAWPRMPEAAAVADFLRASGIAI